MQLIRKALSIIGFALKGHPKWEFGVILGVGATKIFGGKVHPSLELRVSDIFGPDLTRRVVEFCVAIAICHRRNFGQVWGSVKFVYDDVDDSPIVNGMCCLLT